MKKTILVVTERRADYSKFRPIIKQIEKSKKLDYKLIVTGSHLLKKHGYTISEIRQDGFHIDATFSMYSKNKPDTGAEMAKAIGRSLLNLSKLIEKIKPDVILSGFDIGANLAAAIVGAHMNIVVAHLEGGEVTGTIDESIRHAITKFAHIHFVTNKDAYIRLIKMGENPKYVYIVGNPSLDSIIDVEPIDKAELEKEFGLNMTKPFIIIIQHTVTTEINVVDTNMKITLDAIKELGIPAILIYGNADAGSKKISKIIDNTSIKKFSTIPFDKYINLLKHAAALIGNSSSGIMEAPFVGIPSINIGTRQEGRLRSGSVIDVNYDKNEIKTAIKKILYDKKFRTIIRKNKGKSPYGTGTTSSKIVTILEQLNLEQVPIQKKMSY